MNFPATPMVVRGERVATPKGIVPATLHLAGGRVMRVAPIDDTGGARAAEILDAEGRLVIPGLVDTHVHLNEPGRAEWEGFETGTLAAAAGGITTLLDMPLNSIPATTKVASLAKKRAAAEGKCRVDVGFLAGVVPGNSGDLRGLWNDGVFAFKCFLVPSGVDEFRNVTAKDLQSAMPILAELRAPLMVHAELPGPIEAMASEVKAKDARSYATYLSSRPPAAEVQAVQMMLEMARHFDVRLHIVHVSAAEVLKPLREARAHGVEVTAETCPHYLMLDAAQIPNGATEFKCAPPIRGGANREMLWEALKDGTLDMIVSDHSPCPPEMKKKDTGDFFAAWGGVASLELTLSLVSSGMRARSIPFERLLKWMCECPAQLAGGGLQRQKGKLATGYQADFAILDDSHRFDVKNASLKQRHHITPYGGLTLGGRVDATYLRGQLIYREGETVGPAQGRMLRRENA